jgi:hypothetical protein
VNLASHSQARGKALWTDLSASLLDLISVSFVRQLDSIEPIVGCCRSSCESSNKGWNEDDVESFGVILFQMA